MLSKKVTYLLWKPLPFSREGREIDWLTELREILRGDSERRFWEVLNWERLGVLWEAVRLWETTYWIARRTLNFYFFIFFDFFYFERYCYYWTERDWVCCECWESWERLWLTVYREWAEWVNLKRTIFLSNFYFINFYFIYLIYYLFYFNLFFVWPLKRVNSTYYSKIDWLRSSY